MSETNIPEEQLKTEELNGKSLAELSEIFTTLKDSADAMLKSREATAIKDAFYRLLNKLKAEAGDAVESFNAVEENFKAIYADYKQARSNYLKEQEVRFAENLEKKKALIEDLKNLIEGDTDPSAQMPAFREIQDKWKAVGPVSPRDASEINQTYHHQVENFYDLAKISRELRDLDFKKNLEAKEALCELAEKLKENEKVVDAFNELQKLHEQWKELGPVAKEKREEIWTRFKAATTEINKRYQDFFEQKKAEFASNLDLKTKLCEKLEELVGKEPKTGTEWNNITKKISDLQTEWKSIGPVLHKDSEAIYARFRKSCDDFFSRKREYFASFKDSMSENLDIKTAIVKEAEELRSSTAWKETSEKLKELQQRWKDAGALPRKKSEELWHRFRSACDEFFENRDRNFVPDENDYRGNLIAKKRLVADINAFEKTDDETANADAMRVFRERWNSIGKVPFKEKDNLTAAFKKAMEEKFPLFRDEIKQKAGKAVRSAKSTLMDKHRELEQEIRTFENNIGFFSKGSGQLVQEMQKKIDDAKAELAALEARIREEIEKEENNG